MSDRSPSYELRVATRSDVLGMFEKYHGYKSMSASCTYLFAVFESDLPVAAFAWQPPPVGAAKSVCPEAPQGVLSLSRMVAVPKELRQLKHISKPLRRQMSHMIDRTRWPVLVTYSDEGQGHNGFVYECSGWTSTIKRRAPVFEDATGARCSSYSNGKTGGRELVANGHTMIQRWEAWACPRGQAALWMTDKGWTRVPTNKRWKSGNQAFTYQRTTV